MGQLGCEKEFALNRFECFFLEITSLNQRKHSDRARESWLNLIWEDTASRDEQADPDKSINGSYSTINLALQNEELQQFLTVSAMQIGLHVLEILYLLTNLYVSVYTHYPVM